MCQEDIFFYRECYHRKTAEVTPCAHGYNTATQRCNFNIQQSRIRYEPSRHLCPPFYREVEEQICDGHDAALRYIQADVQTLRDQLTTLERKKDVAKQSLIDDSQSSRSAVADHEEMLANVMRMIERKKEEAEENRRSRRRVLKAFRDNQKVRGMVEQAGE